MLFKFWSYTYLSSNFCHTGLAVSPGEPDPTPDGTRRSLWNLGREKKMKEYKYICEDDNSLMASNDENEFLEALKSHLAKHDMTGVTLNDAAQKVLEKVKREMNMAE